MTSRQALSCGESAWLESSRTSLKCHSGGSNAGKAATHLPGTQERPEEESLLARRERPGPTLRDDPAEHRHDGARQGTGGDASASEGGIRLESDKTTESLSTASFPIYLYVCDATVCLAMKSQLYETPRPGPCGTATQPSSSIPSKSPSMYPSLYKGSEWQSIFGWTNPHS